MNQIITKENIENLIYEIRGQQVMLDSDLARLYECTNGTKDINKAVKRNIERFPNDFYFQLTKEEIELISLRFQTGTLNKSNNMRGQHYKYLPYVFTEQGVAMLASVLHTKIAEKMSVAIMRAFVKMRHYLNNNEYRLTNIETKVIEHDNSIKLLQESFDKLEEKKKVNEIFFNGQIYDAYSKIKEIFTRAKKKLIIIDSYADNTILDIVKNFNIEVIIITRKNNLLTEQDILKYNKQYHNLKVIYDNTFHDRYFILDNKELYHCGTSINKIGYKTFSINLVGDNEVLDSLKEKISRLTQS